MESQDDSVFNDVDFMQVIQTDEWEVQIESQPAQKNVSTYSKYAFLSAPVRTHETRMESTYPMEPIETTFPLLMTKISPKLASKIMAFDAITSKYIRLCNNVTNKATKDAIQKNIMSRLQSCLLLTMHGSDDEKDIRRIVFMFCRDMKDEIPEQILESLRSTARTIIQRTCSLKFIRVGICWPFIARLMNLALVCNDREAVFMSDPYRFMLELIRTEVHSLPHDASIAIANIVEAWSEDFYPPIEEVHNARKIVHKKQMSEVEDTINQQLLFLDALIEESTPCIEFKYFDGNYNGQIAKHAEMFIRMMNDVTVPLLQQQTMPKCDVRMFDILITPSLYHTALDSDHCARMKQIRMGLPKRKYVRRKLNIVKETESDADFTN